MAKSDVMRKAAKEKDVELKVYLGDKLAVLSPVWVPGL